MGKRRVSDGEGNATYYDGTDQLRQILLLRTPVDFLPRCASRTARAPAFGQVRSVGTVARHVRHARSGRYRRVSF